MSRIGKKPVTVPAGVTIDVQGNHLQVKGSAGQLALDVHERMEEIGRASCRERV